MYKCYPVWLAARSKARPVTPSDKKSAQPTLKHCLLTFGRIGNRLVGVKTARFGLLHGPINGQSDRKPNLPKSATKLAIWSEKIAPCNRGIKGTELKQTAAGHTGVLGVSWSSEDDTITFHVSLNFSKKRHGQRTGLNLREEDVPELLPQVLTKRLGLQQVMVIYDPMGLVTPFTLQAKVYLRETWLLKLD